VNTVYSPKLFGYSNEVAGSDFYVFSPNCLTKIDYKKKKEKKKKLFSKKNWIKFE
jgi:hypothetical protein